MCRGTESRGGLAVQANRLPRIPHINTPKVNNARKGFLDGGDLAAVIINLPERLQPLVGFAAITGWRKDEILTLKWSEVDLDAQVVRLDPGTTKSGEGRMVPYAWCPNSWA